MATRLYPVTQIPENLERLARVPAGTHAALKPYMDVLLDGASTDEAYTEAMGKISSSPSMTKLYGFLDKGYGRVGDAILGLHKQSQKVVGSSDIRHVAMLHGLELSTEEIAWTEGLLWY